MKSSYILTLVVCYMNCAECANILGIFPFPSYSHQILHQPIWRELSLRGHKVTVITPDPLNDPSLTNLTEVNARYLYDSWKQLSIQDSLSKDGNIFINFHLIYSFADANIETLLSNADFQKLISDDGGKKSFDLVILESSPAVTNAIGEKFQAPVVTICPLGGVTSIYDVIGDPNHPVLYPDNALSFHGHLLSLSERVVSFLYTIWNLYYHYCIAIKRSEKMADKFFGKNIPHVTELEKNISMTFVNVHPLIYPRRPNSPALKEVYELHFTPKKPLPKDLQQILDESEKGVIYFSLGSNIKSAQLENDLRRIILEALSELPYTFIWKYESDHLPNKPPNVIIRKWLPQQDILSHPNIRAFVTQGGLQSISESISNAVPMVGLPFIGDQPMNLKKIVSLGLGIGLDPVTVTKEELKHSIMEVAENKAYKERIKQIRKRTSDKPMQSVEEAIWWFEYVIRHKGARHLRSPNATISWFDYLMLDVITILIILVTMVWWVYKKVRKIFQNTIK